MDAPVYKKLVDLENLHENPHGTPVGQLVVSTSENFWARLVRLGRWRNQIWDGTTLTAGTTAFPSALQTSPNHIFYPKRVVISANVDCACKIQVATSLGADSSYYVEAYVKAGTPLVINFDGEVCCFAGGSVSAIVTNASANGLIFGSVTGVEVACYV